MRDAILTASSLSAFGDCARIWDVFAARGMGAGAQASDPEDTTPVASFARPGRHRVLARRPGHDRRRRPRPHPHPLVPAKATFPGFPKTIRVDRRGRFRLRFRGPAPRGRRPRPAQREQGAGERTATGDLRQPLLQGARQRQGLDPGEAVEAQPEDPPAQPAHQDAPGRGALQRIGLLAGDAHVHAAAPLAPLSHNRHIERARRITLAAVRQLALALSLLMLVAAAPVAAKTITGGKRADRLRGTSKADIIRGGRGNDRIAGRGGKDKLFGQRGRDRIDGGRGNDRVDGGASADRLKGSSGRDRVRGRGGNDRLSGGTSADRLTSDSGDDTVRGGTGNDRLAGGPGGDKLFGDLGNDVIFAGRPTGADGTGDDLFGGAGNDRLRGDTGIDRVEGGPGNDNMTGGNDEDDLVGGTGNDRIDARDGAEDTIDCGPGEDTVLVDVSEDGVTDCETVVFPPGLPSPALAAATPLARFSSAPWRFL